MSDIVKDLEILGLEGIESLSVRDVKKAYKKKAVQVFPEKNPDNPKAHSRFEEINSAFVKVFILCLMGFLIIKTHKNRY